MIVKLFNQYVLGDELIYPELLSKTIDAILGLSEAKENSNNSDHDAANTKNQLKTMMDECQRLFEDVYIALSKLDCQLAEGFFEKRQDCFQEIDVSSLDYSVLERYFDETIAENEAYISKNPSTKWKVDESNARIWTSNYPNEGRKRGYRLNNESLPDDLKVVLNCSSIAQRVTSFCGYPVSCQSILFEELKPIDISVQQNRWHLDKLAHQIKVFIPLHDILEKNGPTKVISNSLPETLISSGLERSHLHHAYIFSAIATTNSNFFSLNEYPEGYLIKDVLPKKGKAIILDTRALHTGSACSEGHRKMIVLTFDVESTLNTSLSTLKPLY